MKRLTILALALVAAAPLAAQGNADTLRYGLYGSARSIPTAFVRGQYVVRNSETRTGPDSAPASTANADSVLFPTSGIKGYSISVDAWGTASTSNAKSLVVTLQGAGTTKLDSLQFKTGGGTWRVHCDFVVRNATSGAATGDSTQAAICWHNGSADSSTTSAAAPLTTTAKFIATSAANAIAFHNATGTAKGDVVVSGVVVKVSGGGNTNQ